MLNTSLNTKGMPIVETPKDAIDLFLSCGLDVLFINNYKVSKKQSNQ
ncbi:Nodulation protein nolNO [Yersinia enterocolitica]|nr:Nodulation protein nolNO [Yersinia enterocolitica]